MASADACHGHWLYSPSVAQVGNWNPWNTSGDIWLGLFVQLSLVFAWIIYEIWYATHRNTSVGQVQADAAGDSTATFLLLLVCAGLARLGALQWWFYYSTVRLCNRCLLIANSRYQQRCREALLFRQRICLSIFYRLFLRARRVL
jgi:hypothetical protein